MTPDFSAFGKPTAATAKPGAVVCLDCRREVAKQFTTFEVRETGYVCHPCAAIRRRKFWAKVGSVVLAIAGGIFWFILRAL